MHYHTTHAELPSITRFVPALFVLLAVLAAFTYVLPASADIEDGVVLVNDANLVRGLANADYGFTFTTDTAATASAITVSFPTGYTIASGTMNTAYVRCGVDCTDTRVITVGDETVAVESVVGSSTARTITITLVEATELDVEDGVAFMITWGITNPTAGGLTGTFAIMTNAEGETAQTNILGVVITPSPVTDPAPKHNATGVVTTTMLKWKAGTGADYYVVYLAKTWNLKESHRLGTTTALTFTPKELLDVNTNYYWRVDGVNISGTTTGPVWAFRTALAGKPADDDDDKDDHDKPDTGKKIPPGLAKKGPILISEHRLMELMEHVKGLQHAATRAAPHSAVGRAAFLRDLMYGAEGDDVQELQRFLNEHGFVVSTTGPGSVGNETRYFGPATRAAVKRYQEANDIFPPEGYFGPKSRAHAEAKRDKKEKKDKSND
jgi:hypothetical protein